MSDPAFNVCGPMTGRLSSSRPNYSNPPQSNPRAIRVGIPLDRFGKRWRMAQRNVRDTFSTFDGKPCASFMGYVQRAHGSREAALKYARKLWPSTRVRLVSYGLEVTVFRRDPHVITAINLRVGRSEGKRLCYASIYAYPMQATWTHRWVHFDTEGRL